MRLRGGLLVAAATAACLAPLQAQQEYAAKVLTEMGQVSFLKDGVPQALVVGDPTLGVVHVKQIIVTGPNSYAKFEVPDGSTFEVFENSTVTFRDNYPSWSDLLNVLIGRVKVFIDHSKGPNPKNVTTPTAVVSVRGTIFDVVVEDTDGTTFITVDDGLVQVRNTTAPGPEPQLKTGDSIRIYRGQPLAPVGIDHAAIFRAVIKAAEQAVYQVVYGQKGGGGPLGIPGGGAQGDKGKSGTGTTTAPAPPTAPSAPTAPTAPSTTGH
jgi:hypothetical protein